MNFRTTFTIPRAEKLLNFGDSIILLGSCFSERIGLKLKYYGFDTLINPFGTLFHPIAIARLLTETPYKKPRILSRNQSWFTYEAHSFIQEPSEEELMTTFKNQKALLKSYLEKAKLLVVTFGSSWGYYLDGEIVSNCHKSPAHIFEKKLSSPSEMTKIWEEVLSGLKSKYPNLEVLFTVSPVRHIRDGIIENQRSKARLIELIHQLDAYYFPSYEVLMDDLRDYRFYEADMIHPNATAVDYIFELFSQHKIAEESRRYFPIIHKFRMFEAHQILPFHPVKQTEHEREVELKRESLQSQIPHLKLEKLKDYRVKN